MRPATLALLAGILASHAAEAQPLTVTFRNTVDLPNTAVDQHGQPFTIAGLSGVRTSSNDPFAPFFAVMDNSNKVVRLSITSGSDATIESVSLMSGVSVAETYDFEGIGYLGPAFRWLLADEGTPALREYGEFSGSPGPVTLLPTVFSSIRPGFGIESLAQRDSQTWIANEEALTVDGPLSSENAGTVVRLQQLIGPSLAPGAQYAYRTEPWHGAAMTGARSGLCDLVIIPDGRMLALERSFALNLSGFFQTRIYELDFTGATDVSALPGLIGQTYTPVTKRLLYQGDQQNMEGLTDGRRTGPGRYILVGIVDDGDPISVNRVVGFELAGVGPPLACYPNCDGSNAMILLSANDLVCFINAYAAGNTYANCDASTGTPALTANDFVCFLGRYAKAAGCP